MSYRSSAAFAVGGIQDLEQDDYWCHKTLVARGYKIVKGEIHLRRGELIPFRDFKLIEYLVHECDYAVKWIGDA